MQTLNNLSLSSIVPSSISQDSQIQALIKALDPELNLITNSITQTVILARIDELDEQILNYLAWQFHVDFYDLAGTLEAKREQVKNSIQWHMKKGTAWAIVKALDMIGIDAEFINWPDYGGKPYNFKIKARVRRDYFAYADKDKLAENITRAINESKAARSLLESLDAEIIDIARARLYSGIAQGVSGNELMQISKPESPGNLQDYIGIAQAESGQQVLSLSRPDGSESKLYHAAANYEARNIEIGVDESIMQELLESFETRIFEKFKAQTELILQEVKDYRIETNARLDEVIQLLQWEEGEADA